VPQYVRIIVRREDFGVRWQSAAATPLFDCGQSFQSGVALRFPPQSKFFWLRLNVFVCLVCFVVNPFRSGSGVS
jgi:hypothetical protein